jgi:hypothetical protein
VYECESGCEDLTMLRLGSVGEEVRRLQARLKEIGELWDIS